MAIVKTNEEDRIVYTLTGRLDAGMAPELEAELSSVSEPIDLVFDMTDLAYISSAGLRTMVFTKQRMGDDKDIIVKNPNEFIMEVLDATGLLDLFKIQQDPD